MPRVVFFFRLVKLTFVWVSAMVNFVVLVVLHDQDSGLAYLVLHDFSSGCNGAEPTFTIC